MHLLVQSATRLQFQRPVCSIYICEHLLSYFLQIISIIRHTSSLRVAIQPILITVPVWTPAISCVLCVPLYCVFCCRRSDLHAVGFCSVPAHFEADSYFTAVKYINPVPSCVSAFFSFGFSFRFPSSNQWCPGKICLAWNNLSQNGEKAYLLPALQMRPVCVDICFRVSQYRRQWGICPKRRTKRNWPVGTQQTASSASTVCISFMRRI